MVGLGKTEKFVNGRMAAGDAYAPSDAKAVPVRRKAI